MQDEHQPTSADRQLSPRKQWLFLAVAAIVALIVVAGIVLAKHLMESGSATGPSGDVSGANDKSFLPTKEQLASLHVAAVELKTFRSERVTDGSIALNDDATTPVFSPYSGRVTRLAVKPGDVVRAGAPLMTVEASEFVQGQNDLVSAHSAMETARGLLQLAQQTEERQHLLFQSTAGSQKDYLQAQSDRLAAQGNLRTAETALAAARNRLRILGRSEAQIAAIEAGDTVPEGAQADVLAPISGTITQRQVGVGQYIVSATSGATIPLFAISNLNTVWLVANAREVDAPLLHLGQEVEVQVFAYPQRTFRAKITWIAPGVDPATHRLPVRAEVDNHDGALKPMMFASFSIVVGAGRSAVGVPKGAVMYEGEQARVWLMGQDGRITARPIRVGRNQGEFVEVLEGLSPGDHIVTSGTLFIDRAIQG